MIGVIVSMDDGSCGKCEEAAAWWHVEDASIHCSRGVGRVCMYIYIYLLAKPLTIHSKGLGPQSLFRVTECLFKDLSFHHFDLQELDFQNYVRQ